MSPQRWRLSNEELDLATMKTILESQNITEDRDNEDSNGEADEWASKEDTKLVKELENQAIMDAY